jgi:hypothetical protein
MPVTENRYVLFGLFLIAISCVISANFVLFAMIGEINRKLPDDQRISYFWFHPAKYRRIYNEYRRLFPAGRYLIYYRSLLYSGFALLGVFAWRFGMFR